MPADVDSEQARAVRALLEEFASAWNVADEERLARVFEPASGRVRSYTESFRGRDRVRAWFEQTLAGPLAGSRLRVLGTETDPGPWTGRVSVQFELTPAGQPAYQGVFETQVVAPEAGQRPTIAAFWSHSLDGKAWPGPFRVGGRIREPKKIHDVSPEYPDVARQARVQGVVILDCLISAEGEVIEARVLRGIPLLDQAAVDAVRQWRFEPTLVDGEPVSVFMTVTVSFRLS